VRDQDEADIFPIEYIHSLTPSGMPEHVLSIKVGSVVMLLRNMFIKEGLCNGNRMFVERCDRDTITATIMFGNHRGKTFTLPRIVFRPDEEAPVKFLRTQVPVRLAFAMTINKAQGQTLEKVGVYLPQPVFSHGQLYVAMSRVRSFASLKIKVVDIKGGRQQQGKIANLEGTYTKNIVAREVLSSMFIFI